MNKKNQMRLPSATPIRSLGFRSLGLLALPLTFALAGISISSKAEAQSGTVTHFPFQYTDPSLAQRPDIQGLLPDVYVTVIGDPARRMTEVQLPEARLTFFTEIAEILGRATIAADGGSGPAQPMPTASCQRHQSAASLTALVSPTCGDVIEAIEGANDICLSVAEPERMVHEDHKPGEVNFAKMLTLEGILKTMGDPLSRLPFPGTLNTPELRQQMRTILWKIRKGQLTSRLDSRIYKYSKAARALNKRSDCAQNAGVLNQSIAELSNELNSLRSMIEVVDRTGRELAARDKKAAEASGRKRRDLPWPSLTDQERQLLSIYIGGVFWRARGGGLLEEPKGTQETRIAFTLLPMRMLAYLNGGEDGTLVGESVFFNLFEPWNEWQDMGRMTGDKFIDLAGMSARGKRQTSLARGRLVELGYDPSDMLIGGLQMGSCYFYSWEKFSSYQIGPEKNYPYTEFLEVPTAWGEACTGAVISLGMAKSLLKGSVRDFDHSR